MQSTSAPMAPVTRRRVFYIPGYDPFPARKYRELYRAESAKQAAISGYDVQVHARDGQGVSWSVQTTVDGITTQAEITVLEWSDLVKTSMATSIAATYAQLLHTVWIYVRHSALWPLLRLRKGPVVVAFYPIVVLLLQLMSAFCAVAAIAVLVPGAFLSVALGTAAFCMVLWMWRRLDPRILAHYLMHDFAYTAQHRGAYPPALDARMSDFAQRIQAALRDDVDEVLVVGHSTGAHLAVTCLSRVLEGGEHPKNLSLLTLGHVMPMITFLPKSNGLRSEINALSSCKALTWVDISAPSDPCAFALCDPVHVSGVAGASSHQPLVLSAAFTQTLSKAALRRVKRRPLAAHFQYLCAFDRPGDFDYFLICGGPIRLRARFARRGHSPGRKTYPQSPFGRDGSR